MLQKLLHTKPQLCNFENGRLLPIMARVRVLSIRIYTEVLHW